MYQKEDGLVFLRVYVPEGVDSEYLGDSIVLAIRTTNYQIDSTHSSQFFDVYLPPISDKFEEVRGIMNPEGWKNFRGLLR